MTLKTKKMIQDYDKKTVPEGAISNRLDILMKENRLTDIYGGSKNSDEGERLTSDLFHKVFLEMKKEGYDLTYENRTSCGHFLTPTGGGTWNENVYKYVHRNKKTK